MTESTAAQAQNKRTAAESLRSSPTRKYFNPKSKDNFYFEFKWIDATDDNSIQRQNNRSSNRILFLSVATHPTCPGKKCVVFPRQVHPERAHSIGGVEQSNDLSRPSSRKGKN
jgi:hypothetical protein